MSEHLTQTQIEDYGRSRLPAGELLSVFNHLDLCEACRRSVERGLNGDAAFFALTSEVRPSASTQSHLTSEQASKYVDDLLAPEELQAVKDHVTGCEACLITVDDLRV